MLKKGQRELKLKDPRMKKTSEVGILDNHLMKISLNGNWRSHTKKKDRDVKTEWMERDKKNDADWNYEKSNDEKKTLGIKKEKFLASATK